MDQQLAEFFNVARWPIGFSAISFMFVLMYKLWRFFTTDFLSPWRTDTAAARVEAHTARVEAQAARVEASEARDSAEHALARAFRCETREARLIYHLRAHGIDLPVNLNEEPK